jgi:hypothetical protein
MKIIQRDLEPIPPGSNPFVFDLHNMGEQIGNGLMLMFGNHPGEPCKYLILVDIKSGERVRLQIEQEKDG